MNSDPDHDEAECLSRLFDICEERGGEAIALVVIKGGAAEVCGTLPANNLLVAGLALRNLGIEWIKASEAEHDA